MPHLLSIEAERRRQPPATATSSASTPYTSDGRTAATADRERGLHCRVVLATIALQIGPRGAPKAQTAEPLSSSSALAAEQAFVTGADAAAFPVWLATGAGFPTPSP
uniref:Uncharacterized protein n=1 Tax=Oryza meridionalis TaxID=40149 RepID=A0A0E0DB35_9ORYZ